MVRNELMNMIRFWLNKGVDGFRMVKYIKNIKKIH